MADSVQIKITGDDTDFRAKMSGIGGVAKKGFQVAAAAVTAFAAVSIKQLADLAEETREYREDMAKLETAFTTAGFSSEQATKSYKDMFAVLGEEDRSVETVNHLAKLCDTQQELDKWTTICTGVLATFGDSLPIEGLTEAANETAKVGQVVGPLADALNWAGISEDAFNASLAACSTEQERQALITETLNGLYSDAANKYREVNASVLDANRAQSDYTDTIAAIGAKVEPIMTALKMGWTNILQALLELVEGVDIKAYAEKIVKAFQSFDTEVAISHVANLINTIKNFLPVILTVISAMGAWKTSLTIATIVKGLTTSIKGCQAALLLYSKHGQLASIATTGFTTAQKALIVVMGVATGKIKLMALAQKALDIAFKANPIGLIITSITVLIGVIVLLWNKCEWFRGAVLTIWDALKTAFSATIYFFKLAFEKVKEWLSALWDKTAWLRELLSAAFNEIKEMLFAWVSVWIAAFGLIVSAIQLMWEGIKAIWDMIAPYLLIFWETVKLIFFTALEAIKGFFLAAWEGIKLIWSAVQPFFVLLWEGIKAVFSVVAEVLGFFFSTAWEGIKFIWNTATGFFQLIWDSIKQIFSVVAAVLSGNFGDAWKGIKFIWDLVVTYFGGIWHDIKAVFSDVAAKFSEWFRNAKNEVTAVWDKIKDYFNGVLGDIASVFDDTKDGIVAKFKKWFEDAYNKVGDFFTVDNFKEVFNTSIVGGLGKIVDAVKTKAGEIWEEIKKALSKPIKVVLDFLGIGGGDGGGDYATEGASGKLTPYGARISSPYGVRRKDGKVHTGIDFATRPGTPIQSATNGKVIVSKNLGRVSYGQYVVVQDTQGFHHYYAHMSQRRAVVGQPVGRGSTIGYVGSTGNSTGPHLHYEVRRPGGGHTNPSPWWKAARGYATGGFPSLGEMFVANENGIEMMGKMGSKNVIANNMQIVEGIKAGIYSGMVNVARAKGSVNNKSVEVTQNMHFYKENVSPSDTKRAARKGVKLGLAGDIK